MGDILVLNALHRRRKQIGSVEAMLCRMKCCRNILDELLFPGDHPALLRPFHLQGRFDRCTVYFQRKCMYASNKRLLQLSYIKQVAGYEY